MTILKFLKPVLVLWCCFTIRAQDSDAVQKAAVELEIANLELQDECDSSAAAIKGALITNSFPDRLEVAESSGTLLKRLSENLKPFESDIPQELIKNWTLLVKPGDALLTQKDWNALVTFRVDNDELVHTATVHCKNNTQECQFIKKGYDDILKRSRNEALLQKGWTAWQTLLAWKMNRFPDVLSLVDRAAQLNGKDSARTYWEMLVDKEDAYTLADDLWEQVKPLYFKLHGFVKDRLFRFYNISDSEGEIPTYLLGSQFGTDWSAIAGIVLPHPQLHHEAEAFLNKTQIKEVYRRAERLTQNLSLGLLGDQFWAHSLFNMSFCENHLLSFCVKEHSELLACDEVSWGAYLDAFEVAMDVVLRNLDYLNLARYNLRYPVVDEAVKGMGVVLAMENLRSTGVWRGDPPSDDDKMTELLLVALRTLPGLPYYLAADKWRLHLLEHGLHDVEDTWWKLRKEYQGVRGVFNNESDFLGDPHVVSNTPYLGKFLATILQFQFLEYYKADSDTLADKIGRDPDFLTMLRERSSTDWPNVIVNYHAFYDLSASALLDFFAPLEDYLQSAPLEQAAVVTTTPEPTTTTAKIVTRSHGPHFFIGKVPVSTEPPMRPKHEHVEENLEGENHAMSDISMYIGLALLAGVVAIVGFVVVQKRLKKRRRNNNRRFET